MSDNDNEWVDHIFIWSKKVHRSPRHTLYVHTITISYESAVSRSTVYFCLYAGQHNVINSGSATHTTSTVHHFSFQH